MRACTVSPIDPDTLRIAPLTRAHAKDLVTWRYESPYEVYDMDGAEPDDLLDPAAGFHAVLAGEELVGFRSLGPDGQVPGWDYDDSALDTRGGLWPSLTGQGLGRSVISAGLDYGRVRFAPAAFRVTVASSTPALVVRSSRSASSTSGRSRPPVTAGPSTCWSGRRPSRRRSSRSRCDDAGRRGRGRGRRQAGGRAATGTRHAATPRPTEGGAAATAALMAYAAAPRSCSATWATTAA